MDIDRDAPVVAEATADIGASPDDVWKIVIDMEQWPELYQDIRSVTLEGPVAEGTAFSFQAGPGKLDGSITGIDEPEAFVFEGKGLGNTTTYLFRLEPTDAGTHLTVAQSVSGGMAKTMSGPLKGFADRGVRSFADGIKERAEA